MFVIAHSVAGDVQQVMSNVVMCVDHQELFKHLSQQRILSPEVKAKAVRLLEMRANKKMVQQQMCQDTGNIILLKDLSNITTAHKQGKSRNDLDATVSVLMNKYGEQ